MYAMARRSFTAAELDYLEQQRLGRLATVDAHGAPHATATGKYFPMRDEDVPLDAADFFPDSKVISPLEFFNTASSAASTALFF